MRTALIATFAAGAAAFAPGPVARRPRTTMMAAGRPSTLVLLRHGESTWNNLNKFTGWYDCPLSEKGVGEATAAGPLLKDAGLVFDVAHTSYLQRAIKTLWLALEGCGQMSVPQKKSWRLNERHYGALQGLDKQETVAKHGIDQVNVWRRSYDIPPPAIEDLSSEHFPGNDPKYSAVPPELLPKSESLALTAARFESYWADEVVPDLRAGKTVLIAAHGNTLRALVQVGASRGASAASTADSHPPAPPPPSLPAAP